MEFLVASAVGLATAVGIYLVLRAQTFPVVLGLTFLSYAVNVYLFAMGRLVVGQPPIVTKTATGYTDPLTQALVLTAIVISFGMTALLVVLALRGYLETGRDHRRPLRHPGGPALNHWIIVPVVLPALVAPFLVAAARTTSCCSACSGSRPRRRCSRGDGPLLAGLGRRHPPLRARRLAGTVRHRPGPGPPLGADAAAHRHPGAGVAVYAAQGWDRRGRHFHALFQFQLMGVNGAFLTGDVFNLFVFFEVLLIASYGLMLHGAGARRITEGLKYVAINLAGSTLFLFAVGLIYALTGTLNMADLALKVPLVPESDLALLRLGGALLLIVFAIKGALVPLHLWLPGTYGAASPPVAAFFAIMTKVGAYAILRVYVLIFGGGAGAASWLAEPYVLPAAAVTLALGMIGVLASRTLTSLAVYALWARSAR